MAAILFYMIFKQFPDNDDVDTTYDYVNKLE